LIVLLFGPLVIEHVLRRAQIAGKKSDLNEDAFGFDT
jgi:hypothetical protein